MNLNFKCDSRAFMKIIKLKHFHYNISRFAHRRLILQWTFFFHFRTTKLI